jgi:predicted nucleic acid-binding Zn ribbon protein
LESSTLKICPVCGIEFSANVHNQLYCSSKCSHTKWKLSRQNGIRKKYPNTYFKDKSCRNCGTIFKPSAPSHHYCSEECADIGKKDAYYSRNYSITLEEYKDLVALNDSKCWICGVHNDDIHNSLAVDHCHTTGKVRGILCHNCNVSIGKLGDTSEALLKAYNYLKKFEESK